MCPNKQLQAIANSVPILLLQESGDDQMHGGSLEYHASPLWWKIMAYKEGIWCFLDNSKSSCRMPRARQHA